MRADLRGGSHHENGYSASAIYASRGWRYRVAGFAPKNTPAEVAERLNKEVNAALADSGFKSHLAGLGNDPVSMSSADFGKLLAEETEKWAKVIPAANIKAG